MAIDRVTQPTLEVLAALMEAHAKDEQLHGWLIMKATGRSGPTVYGVLDRLEDANWVAGEFEVQAESANHPRRRFYRFTDEGVARARELLAERM